MGQEHTPDNVVYLDEYRKERFLVQLRRAREDHQAFLFGQELLEPGQLILFPGCEDPDGVA